MSDTAERLSELSERLADPEELDWQTVAKNLMDEWGKTDSIAVSYLLDRGIEAAEDDNLTSAIEHLTAAIDHAPDFGQAYYMRGNVYFRMDEFGLSLENFIRATQLIPDHFDAYHGIAASLEMMEEYDGALTAYEEANRLNPHLDTLSEGIERLQRRVRGWTL